MTSGDNQSKMPKRLYLFHTGANDSPSPYPVYLIQTNDGRNILVDTGFPSERYNDAASGENDPEKIAAENHVVDQLATLGLSPHDVDILISTHFDGDHAGNNDAFPDAEIVVQREHFSWAQGAERVAGVRSHWDKPGLDYRQIDGDVELRPGIKLIETSGHVPGHQSVLVTLPKTGNVLLAIDAVTHTGNRDAATRQMSQYDMDEPGIRASTAKLAKLEQDENVALTIYGHDRAQWDTLRHAPEYYE
ncbi:MAG TPA: N-acyl homoserine lactonase family protein [Thermomicrobiaceae bacterium]|nr:N-acyl homoserine lactonase family protein [Thermomicrobiaceae bacterium]